MSRQSPRFFAVSVLNRWFKDPSPLDSLMDSVPGRPKDPRDSGLAAEIIYGVIRNQNALRWIGEQLVKTPPTMDVQVVLWTGFYQAFFLERIPEHALVNESVNLVPQGKRGFVNAVLRQALRKKDSILEELSRQPEEIRFSIPHWLINRWRGNPYIQDWNVLVNWMQKPADVFLRINTLKTSVEDFVSRCAQSGFEVEKLPEFPLSLRLISRVSIEALPGFLEGHFYVQDPSTLRPVELLNPQPGELFLDYCAAPGGKSTYAAQLMKDQGRVIASDVSSERLEMVRQNVKRLGLSSVETFLVEEVHRALSPASADHLLLDVPCSNTGVLRRRIELRWRIEPQEITRLVELQRKIVEQSIGFLKPGGKMVYSTCSLEVEENEDQVKFLLQQHPGLKLMKQIRLNPAKDEVDGAFAALFAKA